MPPQKKKSVVMKTKSTGMSLEAFNTKEIVASVKKEAIKLRDNKEYRKEIEEQYGDKSVFLMVTALNNTARKMDDSTRHIGNFLLAKLDNMNSSTLAKLAQSVNSYGETSLKAYKNSDLILKGVKQEAELLKKLYTEIIDSKKKSMKLTESLRGEFITSVSAVQNSINQLTEQIKKNYDDELNALNTLGVSNTKIIESVKKEGEAMKTMVDKKLGEMKDEFGAEVKNMEGDLKGVIDEVKSSLGDMTGKVEEKVTNAIADMNSNMETFRTSLDQFKDETRDIMAESNGDMLKQIKAIGGGLSKLSIENTEKVYGEVEGIREVVNNLESSVNESIDRQKAVFDESVKAMKDEVVGGAAKQMSEMKKSLDEFQNNMKEDMEAFKADVNKYLKKEIAELRDSLSQIRADIEMQKHILNTIAEKIRK